jgi:hypothetical protein
VAALQRARHHGGAEQHPLRDKPVKTAYMWRDMERRAAVHDLPIAVPAPYPLPQLPFANQVALLGFREGWGANYMRETYRRWFVDGKRPGEDPNLSDSLAAVGVDPEDVMARARAPEIEAELALADRAREIPRRLRLPQFRRGRRGLLGRRPARSRARLGPLSRNRPRQAPQARGRDRGMQARRDCAIKSLRRRPPLQLGRLGPAELQHMGHEGLGRVIGPRRPVKPPRDPALRQGPRHDR